MEQTVIPTPPLQPRFEPDHPVKRGLNTLLDLFFGATEEEQANEAVLSMMGPLALAKGPANLLRRRADLLADLMRRSEGEDLSGKMRRQGTGVDDFINYHPETELTGADKKLMDSLRIATDDSPIDWRGRQAPTAPRSAAQRRTSFHPTGGEMTEGLTPQQIDWLTRRLGLMDASELTFGPNWEKILRDTEGYELDDVIEKIYQFRAANRGVKTP